MKPIGNLGLAFLAVLALCPVAASSALASPEIGRCEKVAPNAGHYKTANCSKKSSELVGEFEWRKGTAGGKNNFNWKSGTVFLETQSGSTLTCEHLSAAGKYDEDGLTRVTRAVESLRILFEHCNNGNALGEQCHNRGTTEIETEELEGNFGDLQETGSEIGGLELHPGRNARVANTSLKKKLFAEFECAGFIVEMTEFAESEGGTHGGGDCVIGELKKVNEMSLATEFEWATKEPGVQEWQHFLNLKPPFCNLESVLRVPGGKPERATLSGLPKITNEEPLEVKD